MVLDCVTVCIAMGICSSDEVQEVVPPRAIAGAVNCYRLWSYSVVIEKSFFIVVME